MPEIEQTQTSPEEITSTVRIPGQTQDNGIPETGEGEEGTVPLKEKSDTPKSDAEAPKDGEEGDDKSKEDVDPATGKPIDYKEKFANSTREVQRILGENKTFQDSVAEEKATNARLTKEIADLRKLAEGENPEGLEKFDYKKSSDENSRKLAELTLNTELDKFTSKTPGAEDRREALKNLALAFPAKSLAVLWDENFKGISEAQVKAKEVKTTSQKKTQPETGKGTSTSEPGGESIAGMSVAEFNKLSVSKRRQLLTKHGIS